MTVTGPGLFVPTMVAALSNTLAVDLLATGNKWALFSNSVTPDYAADTAYGVAPYNANEVTGTNWPAGGVAVSAAGVGGTSQAPTLAVSSTPTFTGLVFDMANISVAGVVVTAARMLQLYADPLAGNNAIMGFDLGADYDVNGLFEVRFAEAGLFRWRTVPVPEG
jgi:hypothetical protein